MGDICFWWGVIGGFIVPLGGWRVWCGIGADLGGVVLMRCLVGFGCDY